MNRTLKYALALPERAEIGNRLEIAGNGDPLLAADAERLRCPSNYKMPRVNVASGGAIKDYPCCDDFGAWQPALRRMQPAAAWA